MMQRFASESPPQNREIRFKSIPFRHPEKPKFLSHLPVVADAAGSAAAAADVVAVVAVTAAATE